MADNPFSAVLRQIQPSAPSPEDEPYFAALGRFIAAYANAEAQVHILARRLTKLNDAKARIVFSGMRLGDLAHRIGGLLRVTDASTKRYSEIDGCLRQLDLIGTQRNNLVHRFVNYQKGGIIATNIVTSKSISTHEFDTFAIADLENMDSDCTAITLRLAFSRRKMKPEIKTWLNAPWRYKPPLPAPNPKSRSSTPQSRKRRPASSRG